MTSSRFISIGRLQSLAASDRPPLILDIRHQVGTERQRKAYEAGHVPGAVYVELRDELAGPPTPSRGGRNPLPAAAALQSNLRRWGVTGTSPTVVYAGRGQPAAGRAWWVLTWAGVADVHILAGGYEAWVDAGLPVVSTLPEPTPSAFVVSPGRLRDLSLSEALEYGLRGQLVDVRPRADFEDGHMPHAVNLPYGDLTDAGRFPLPTDRLRDLLAQRGVDVEAEVALTCGGGVAAAWCAAILDEIGVPTALHVGSWSEWVELRDGVPG